jgi:hypothetical protein
MGTEEEESEKSEEEEEEEEEEGSFYAARHCILSSDEIEIWSEGSTRDCVRHTHPALEFEYERLFHLHERRKYCFCVSKSSFLISLSFVTVRTVRGWAVIDRRRFHLLRIEVAENPAMLSDWWELISI